MLADLDLLAHKVSLEDKFQVHNISSHEYSNFAVVIVAAGRGNRAPGDIPKQYRSINGETVLTKTLKCFSKFPNIVVVIHPNDTELFKDATKDLPKNIHSISGGDSRTQSVKAGLDFFRNHQPKFVLIHDAARPFLAQDIIDNVMISLQSHQAVAPSLPIVDAIKTKDGSAVDRDEIIRVQTPQGFDYSSISQAYRSLSGKESFVDDIELAKQCGMSIDMCVGDEKNIKLTYEHDFMQSNHMINITGSGFDVHQICSGETLFLCGVEVEAGFSLKGHSDADVGRHALTDAILGAISEGDIGDHFPPSESKWKNAKSDIFLQHAIELLKRKNAILDHVDITLICEQPKIKPHRQNMRERLTSILGIPLSRVSLKATTTEGLGYAGRGEGIAAQAIASIRIPDV